MLPDPKLKAAAEEIKAVLRKYDLAALITLQGVGSVEFIRELSPSWSCARIVELPDGFTIQVKARAADFPSPAIHKATIEATLGMFLGFHHQAHEDTNIMQQMVLAVAKQGIVVSNVISETKDPASDGRAEI